MAKRLGYLIIMALSCKVGSFAANTSTGDQAVTGVGFQPKALMLWMVPATANTSAAHADMLIGMCASATDEHCWSYRSVDAVPTSDSFRGLNNRLIDNAINTYAADLVSFDADGFTINWTGAPGTAFQVNYLALGGADLTNAKVISFDSKTSPAGNQAYTGVGFQSDCILFFTAGDSSLGSNVAIALGGAFGVAKSSTSRAAIGVGSDDAVATSRTYRQQITTKCIEALYQDATFINADFVSMDSDGFTLNWTTPLASTRKCVALCLKGGSYAIGTDTQKTSTGTKATTGAGFTPRGILLASVNAASATGVNAHSRFSFGAASATNARACCWFGDQDNAADTIADCDHDNAAALKMLTEGGAGVPTLNAEADLSSLDSDGFTLNWGTADATAREFVWVAMGDTAAAGGPFPWHMDDLSGGFSTLGMGI